MPGGSGERVVRSDLSVGSITLCLDCGLCVFVCMCVCVYACVCEDGECGKLGGYC